MNTLNYISQLIIPLFIVFAVVYGFARKVNVYASFVSGAKDGIGVIIRIFPYILAIFIAIKGFQASGAFEAAKYIFSKLFGWAGLPPEVIAISIIKPLSGSASLGIFTDMVKVIGPDAPASLISAVIMGSAETTFYVLAVYLGAAGIRNGRYIVGVCLVSDVVGILVSIAVTKLYFGF